MNDLEQAATRAVLRTHYTEISVDHMMSNLLDNERLRAAREVKAVLATLPLTPEQLEGLASGDMVVVPREDVEHAEARKATLDRVRSQVRSAAQEEQP